MDWVPVVFVVFKVAVLGIGMFFAVKWHYDQGRKKNRRELSGAIVKVAGVFALLLLCLISGTWMLATTLGLNLGLTG